MSTAFCLDCDRSIDLGHSPKVGQKTTCPNCETKLEVISLDPVELDWVYDGPAINLGVFDREWGDFKTVGSKLDFDNRIK